MLPALDSLIVGSADSSKRAILKSPQSRSWTSFIECITADGRILTPGIIFKGKELQTQWFLKEFRKIANWHYATSPNGWTDNHLGIEWLKTVYLPQTMPTDPSDARLIILDGHGSHATVCLRAYLKYHKIGLIVLQDEFMAECYLNNIYLCYLPAHCSHGLQPLDNGPFNVLKAAYRRELEKLAVLTDSAPVDKINFIRALSNARQVAFTPKNIIAGWRVTGNWPISRAKALRHPEIQADISEESSLKASPVSSHLGSDNTPKHSRHIRDLSKGKTPRKRRRYGKIAKAFAAHEQTLATHSMRIASLEEQLDRLKRGKKRKAIPNPNRRFMTLGEALAAKEAIPEPGEESGNDSVKSDTEESVTSEASIQSVIEVVILPQSPQRTTRSGRATKKPRKM